MREERAEMWVKELRPTRHGGGDIPFGLGWLLPVIEDFVFAAVCFDFADDNNQDFSLVCAGCPFSPCHVS